jgi:hypothetical protein
VNDELDPRALAILAASREADALPESVRARVWQRVEDDVAAPNVGRRLWIPAIVGLAMAAAIAALWWGGGALEATTRVAAEAAPYDRVPMAAPVSATAPIPAELPPTRPAVETTPPVSTAAPSEPVTRRDAPARPSSAPGAEADPFADELARLRAAQATLATAPAEVIDALDALDRDHPRGALQPERAALRVFASCAIGAADRGRSLAERFAERYPGSPLLPRVRSACDGLTP